MLCRQSTTTRASGFYRSASSSIAALSYIGVRSYSHRPTSAQHTLTIHSSIGPASHTVPLEHRRRGPSLLRLTSSASSADFRSHARSRLRASLTLPAVAGVACIILAALFLHQRQPASPTVLEEAAYLRPNMSGQVLPGRPGNLTPEQEEKLRQLWQMIFQVCAVWPTENGSGSTDAAVPVVEKAESLKAEKTKKKRSMFSRKGKKDNDSDSATTASVSGNLVQLKEGEDDKYGQTKHFHETLANQSPESIRDTIWSMLKHDHPDALVLRFLRARKWDVEKALVMLISTMNWRAQDMHVDDDIMKNGEGAAAELENGTDATARVSRDFLAQIRMGKSFLHGVDKNGRPICVVRVRLHRQGEQLEESLERYTVYIIETCRMLLQPPVDTATIVFDMTGFSMANMDYTPVKFMIKCFEANYPESLGAVLVHKAPWVFQGIWKIIKGWLDPVVAGKVHFTNNVKEVEEFIPLNHIPKELDGEEDWEYKYVEPIPGENHRMKDIETRDRILAEREQQYRDFEDTTIRWIQNPDGEKGKEIKSEREAIASKLNQGYWTLDPYVRARSLYDRTGVIKPGGKVDFYPVAIEATKEDGGPPARAIVETSADDVD
ncbi:CRAL/TRIO domain-containing protein [Coniochaeta sp. PMI_546]|nr:CRAL/TRIO domain-containing protein [Coniochaeta sp. PMI_546]